MLQRIPPRSAFSRYSNFATVYELHFRMYKVSADFEDHTRMNLRLGNQLRFQ